MKTRTLPSSKERTLSSGRGSVSDHSKRYEKPVQPPPRMPTRNPFGVVALAADAFLISATALSVTPMAMSVLSLCPWFVPVARCRLVAALGRLLPLRLVVGDRALDRVLGQHRAVDLDGGQVQLFDDLGVLDRHRLIDRHPFD